VSTVKAGGRKEEAMVAGAGASELVDAELTVGRVYRKREGTESYFVSEVLIPSGGGYVKVDVEPYEKKWVEFSKREKLAKVKYRLPENSIIVYRILREKPDMSREVGVKAFLVTREGLRELEASSERVDVGVVGGRRVYRYDTVVRVGGGDVRVAGETLYVEGVGAVTERGLEQLKAKAEYALELGIPEAEVAPDRLVLWFKATRKLSDEEFKALEGMGFRYRGEGYFGLKLYDRRVDFERVLEFLKENMAGFSEGLERRLRELWQFYEGLREFAGELAGRLGVSYIEFKYDEGLMRLLPGMLPGTLFAIKTEHLGKEKFKELAREFEYVDGTFYIPICHEKVKDLALKYLPRYYNYYKVSIEKVMEECEAEYGSIKRIKEYFKRSYGVEPTEVRVVEKGVYHVKLPMLGKEKFKEIARKFKYAMGGFTVRKEDIES